MLKFPDTFPVLETERLSLLAYSVNDAGSFFQMRSNPEFMKYMAQFPMKNLSEAKNFVERTIQSFTDCKGITWKIALKGTNEMIGYLGFWRIDFDLKQGEIGFGLNPSFQQKGYMQETAKTILEYGFQGLGLESVIADIDPNNLASSKLLQLLGFKKSAYLKDNYKHDGKFFDSEMYLLNLLSS